MLLTQDIDALVIHIDLKGKNHKERTDYAWVECQTGENWHEFIMDNQSKFWWP
jgi:UDP-N-acetylmuramate dehydrogenase